MDLAGCFSNRRKPLDTLIRRVLKGSKRPVSRPAREPIVDERGPVAEDSEQSQTRLNASNRAALVAAYAEGAPVKVLAKRFGVHRTTVMEIARRAGIDRRRPGLSKSGRVEATRLYESGLSLARVAAKLGVSDDSVREAVIACGGIIRSRGRRSIQSS